MDFNTKKILKIINKMSKKSYIDIDTVVNKSNIPKDDFIEIMDNLFKNDFIKFPNNGYVETTNKGKTYLQTIKFKWFYDNILSIIAIIISIIALLK